MLKIGVIGTDGGIESGHSLAVCRIFNFGDLDARVTEIYGENKEETEALAKETEIERIAEKPENMLGRVDAVMVMPRDGGTHLKYALPFIENGMPVFVDKPFTCSVEDARLLTDAAEKSGAAICGGSYVKYADSVLEIKKLAESGVEILSGYIAFPTQLKSPYGFHFYSQHMIEAMLTMFGSDIEGFRASLINEKLVVVAKYREFPVILNYATSYSGLTAGIYLADGSAEVKDIDLSGRNEYQCRKFVESVKTGHGDDLEYFIKTVEVSNAIEKEIMEDRI